MKGDWVGQKDHALVSGGYNCISGSFQAIKKPIVELSVFRFLTLVKLKMSERYVMLSELLN